jgi:dolichyl-diphosphooligosaccharide--protein glycosyltransferase
MRPTYRTVFLLVLLMLGLFLRVNDWGDWKRVPEAALYKGGPLLLDSDGYYYLHLARDLVEGTYQPVDETRGAPTPPPRPSPPPPLSIAVASIVKYTPLTLLWAGALLPPILGVLLAFPVFAWGRRLGGPTTAFVAVLFTLLGDAYVDRTTLARLDTDCLNVFWAYTSAYLFYLFAVTATRRRYAFFILGLGVSAAFILWWDVTPFVAAAIALFPIVPALILYYRPARRERLAFLLALAALVLLLHFFLGFDLLRRFFEEIGTRYGQLFGDRGGAFPRIGISISELGQPSFREVVRATAGTLIGLVVSVIGLLLLGRKRPRELSFLAIPLLLSLAGLASKRFLIFLVPMCGLGVGYLSSILQSARGIRAYARYGVPAGVVLLALPMLKMDIDESCYPRVPPPVVSGMEAVSLLTPARALVWSYWDAGYPLAYWSRRATIADGGLTLGGLPVYNAIPFAAESRRQAANFMRFFAARGTPGMDLLIEAEGGDLGSALSLARRVLAAGPLAARRILDNEPLLPVAELRSSGDWLRFFYPEGGRPLYLVLDARLLETCYWLIWFGSWSPEEGGGHEAFFRNFWSVREEPGQLASPQITVDMRTGEFRREHATRTGRLGTLYVHDDGNSRRITYDGSSDMAFDFHRRPMYAALQDGRTSRSLFTELFLRAEDDSVYFRPVRLEFPRYQLWEVHGDALAP